MRKITNGGDIRAWISLVFAVVIIFALPAIILPQESRIPFDLATSTELSRSKPSYIFVGNSLLGTRINPELFSELSGGGPATVMWEPGIASAGWYLVLKNHIVRTGINPKRVFIFFRDDELTDPLRRTIGTYADRIEKVSTDSEPQFDAVMAANSGADRRLGDFVEFLYPLQSRRLPAENGIRVLATGAVSPMVVYRIGLHAVGQDDSPGYQERLDEFQQLISSVGSIFDRENLRFDANIEFDDGPLEQWVFKTETCHLRN